MTRVGVLAGTSTNPRKRKSTEGPDDTKPKLAKQPRKSLDAYFSPQVLATSVQEDDGAARKHVALNEQQINVMRMVVEEEKSVFFTGSAGESRYRFCDFGQG